MKGERKACVDCWHYVDQSSWAYIVRHKCEHPAIVTRGRWDRVRGEGPVYGVECDKARGWFGKCGPSGKLWEPIVNRTPTPAPDGDEGGAFA